MDDPNYIKELDNKLSRMFVEQLTQDVYRSLAQLHLYVAEDYSIYRMMRAGENLRWCADRIDEFLEIENAKTTE